MISESEPSPAHWWARPSLHVALLALVVGLAYVPDVGHGFVKDDFAWILASRAGSVGDLRRLFEATSGFYRPVVSLSFALNEYASGLSPLGYGLANLGLALLAAGGIGWVARLWRLPPSACVFAAALWLLNLHGINMAVLWISGRTALFLTLFAVLAAAAVAKDRPATAALFLFGALLSKEEAVLLPLPLLLMLVAMGGKRGRIAVTASLFAAAEIAYFVLRARSGAMTPVTAPWFYRFTFDWSQVARNIAEYADRSCTFTLVCLLVLLALVRRRPALSESERRIVAVGLGWLCLGFAITVFLPVRSSLYACFPSAGIAWAGAAAATAIWRAAPPRRQQAAAIAAIVLALALVPVYRVRNVRWVELADLTAGVMPGLEQASRASSDGTILIVDERTTRANIASAFGGLIPEAATLVAGRRRSIWLVPPPSGTDAAEIVAVPPGPRDAWVLRDKRLVRVDAARWTGAEAIVLR
ncbi:MAG: hypothetical protein A3H96_21925 [Acidobacteria bacterium RIFCSPLOWO2_02_FULL_67_36]|nr:MAG: hypothetical protein A3H96_21925 [Acidobacteria bacterium RIFCSPLOWO2_02_FULL_67_36]OFW19853.1 MAG: hypothetical protein A3G21_09520 [Acidobacteria bacterium RIFCSPLOWO2_12_FULL_66_21]